METVDAIPKTYEEAERLLVRWHAEGGPADLVVFSFPDVDHETVRLVEVSDEFAATGVVRPMTFGRSPELPFRSSTALATPEEWQDVEAGRLSLPPGWGLCIQAAGLAVTRQQAFLRQARSDFAIYELLAALDRAAVPECHPLHYLQMATEKMSKAAFEALGITIDPFSHVAFSHAPYHLARRDVARALGYRDFYSYRDFLRRAAPFFRRVDELSPAVGLQTVGGAASNGPNVEYPWEARDAMGAPTWIAPAERGFGLLAQIERGGDAGRMVDLVRNLLNRFEALFP